MRTMCRGHPRLASGRSIAGWHCRSPCGQVQVPYLLSLTKKVMQKVKTNIIASMIINITAVVLSAAGVLTPVTGALWHNFGSVFVVVNAARLLRYRDEKE